MKHQHRFSAHSRGANSKRTVMPMNVSAEYAANFDAIFRKQQPIKQDKPEKDK